MGQSDGVDDDEEEEEERERPPLNVNTRIIRVRERNLVLQEEEAGGGALELRPSGTKLLLGGEFDVGPLIGSGRRHYSLSSSFGQHQSIYNLSLAQRVLLAP